jgi:ankyrin repeat protein
MLAAGAGHHDIARLLIERGADVNAKMPGSGLTPLLFAARDAQNAETFEVLLENGADAKERDASGETALIVAAREGNLKAVQTLIASGADVNDKSLHNGSTALITATAFSGKDAKSGAKAKNHLAVIKALVAAGSDVNAKQKGDYTALMFAAQEGDGDAAQLLLKAGADPSAKNNKGDTAATLAKRNGKLGVLQ